MSEVFSFFLLLLYSLNEISLKTTDIIDTRWTNLEGNGSEQGLENHEGLVEISPPLLSI